MVGAYLQEYSHQACIGIHGASEGEAQKEAVDDGPSLEVGASYLGVEGDVRLGEAVVEAWAAVAGLHLHSEVSCVYATYELWVVSRVVVHHVVSESEKCLEVVVRVVGEDGCWHLE